MIFIVFSYRNTYEFHVDCSALFDWMMMFWKPNWLYIGKVGDVAHNDVPDG